MDRRTAIVLGIVIVTMVAAGVGLLMLMRHVGAGSDSATSPHKLAGPYLEEVELRCDDRYERYALSDTGASQAEESAAHYLEAKKKMPAVDLDSWQALGSRAKKWSWVPGTGDDEPIGMDFTPTTAAIVDGANAPMGRSPYGFCAIDTAGDILTEYRDMAFATEIEARDRFLSGDDEKATSLLASCMIMELDLGRGGGIFGHALSVTMLGQTLERSVSRYAGAAHDAEQIESFIDTMAGIESSWLDLADNARIDGLVMETMYAGCSMPPGWKSPVGPPVIEPETQDTFCALGPLALDSAWSSTHGRSLEIVDALGDPDPGKRYERIEKLEKNREETPSWKKLLAPGDMFADLAFMKLTPQIEADIRGRSMFVLARAALAIRLAYLITGEMTLPREEKTWASLYDGGRPLVDPVEGKRPVVEFEDDHVVLFIQSEFPGWEEEPPTLRIPWVVITAEPAQPDGTGL